MKSKKAEAPVISVGNITAGGTGKTPLVIWLCQWLHANAHSCAVLTRGYKAHKGKFTDEPAIIAKTCPEAKIVINADRTAGAEEAVREYNIDALVMDDGFQHRRLKRDLDIVAVDATCPFGHDRMLPAGLLREPVKNIRRADAVVITRSDQVTAESLEQIKGRIRSIAGNIAIARTVNTYPYAQKIGGARIDFEQLKQRRVFAFCGIGNPAAFVNHLSDVGLEVVGTKIYNDHYNYTEEDIESIYEEASYCQADLVLTTLKDWVKAALLLEPFDKDIDFAFLALELGFAEGRDGIEKLLRRTVRSSATTMKSKHGS